MLVASATAASDADILLAESARRSRTIDAIREKADSSLQIIFPALYDSLFGRKRESAYCE